MKEHVLVDNSNLNISLPKPILLNEGDVSENYTFFKLSWENYLTASGLWKRPEEEEVAILLTAVGEDVFRRFQNFTISADETANCQKLLEAIGRNLAPERAVFNLAKQSLDETYGDYFHRIRSLIKNCQYGTLEDGLMLDKTICSIKDIKLREHLWLNRKITLKEATDRCKDT